MIDLRKDLKNSCRKDWVKFLIVAILAAIIGFVVIVVFIPFFIY